MFAIALISNYLVMRVLFVFLSVVFFSTPFFLLGQNEFGTNSQIIESKWGKNGDSTSASNFIGTVNDSPLIFKTKKFQTPYTFLTRQ